MPTRSPLPPGEQDETGGPRRPHTSAVLQGSCFSRTILHYLIAIKQSVGIPGLQICFIFCQAETIALRWAARFFCQASKVIWGHPADTFAAFDHGWISLWGSISYLGYNGKTPLQHLGLPGSTIKPDTLREQPGGPDSNDSRIIALSSPTKVVLWWLNLVLLLASCFQVSPV